MKERTLVCMEQVKSTVKQHLDCLIDSGANPTEIRKVAKKFCETIKTASNDAIFDLAVQLKMKEEEESSEKD